MKTNVFKVRWLSLMLLAAMCTAFIFSGCQQAGPSKPAADVIKEGIKNLMEVSSASYDLKFSSDSDVKDAGKTVLNVALSGIMDRKDTASPQFSIKLDGSATVGENGGSGSAEIRLNKDALYFNLMKFEMKGDQTAVEQLKMFFAKWWMITIPADAQKEVFAAVPPAGTQQEMTPEQANMKALVEETNFFSNPEYKGTEDVNGEASYRYSVTLDKNAAATFAAKASEIQGTTMTADEISKLNESLKTVSVTGDIYVGTVSNVLNKFNAVIKVDKSGDTQQTATGTVSVIMSLGSINKTVQLEIPADATEFPIAQLLGGMSASTDQTVDVTGSEANVLPTDTSLPGVTVAPEVTPGVSRVVTP